jgi:glycosidase
MTEPWWRSATVYQIYPRSFADSDGDGVGDLEGIIEHLDHVEGLGVDAIWLSPFFPSPQVDFGYDIADYCDVDPQYGTLDTWDRLVAEAHERGLKVVVDGVFNHTSDQHPWFVESRSSRDNPRADWYIWADGASRRRPPNNWRGADIVHSAWHFDDHRGQWYLATFDRCQPDLNWQHPEVRAAMFDVVRFWLDHGVDGFRLDMFGRIMKAAHLGDEPWRPRLSTDLNRVQLTQTCFTSNTEANYELGRDLRRFCREERGGRDDTMLIGECFGELPVLSRYTAGGDGLTHSFIFDVLAFRYRASWFRDAIGRYESAFPYPQDPAYVFENHDRSRLLDRVGGDLRKARVLATILCTVRGQATIYQGQELGMPNTYIPLKQGQDTLAKRFSWIPEAVNRRLGERLNRDEVRTPMQWDASPTAGFCPPGVEPWLPVNPSGADHNVQTQAADPASLLNLYRDLLALRRDQGALRHGRLDLVPGTGTDALAFVRSDGNQRILVAANFSDERSEVPLGGEGSALLATDPAVQVTGAVLALPPHTAGVVQLD